MSGMVQFYRLHDQDPGAHGGAVRIKPEEASEWNQKGFGIFHTINSFNGARKIENLTRINCWAIDMDEGEKPAMLERVRSGLVPTRVVETKRGFHVYFAAKDAKPEHWNSIVLDRLVPYYGADKKARDMARILRAPGYYHLKDPASPFLVQTIWEWHVAYTEAQIAAFYPDQSAPERKAFVSEASKQGGGENFWQAVWNLDCQDALTRLSGRQEIGGEVFTFKPVSRGNLNIYVNGKSTSTFIDKSGRIGSLDGGGPTIAQYIRWYGKSWPETIRIIKELYPELSQL